MHVINGKDKQQQQQQQWEDNGDGDDVGWTDGHTGALDFLPPHNNTHTGHSFICFFSIVFSSH
jgi:hypothetical protein